MNVISVAICLVSVCYAQLVTQHPHTTREPSEYEGLAFIYNGITHDLIVRQRVGKTLNCYIADLTADEEQHVHSDSGLKAVELRVLSQLITATMENVNSIDENNVKTCGHVPVNAQTTKEGKKYAFGKYYIEHSFGGFGMSNAESYKM